MGSCSVGGVVNDPILVNLEEELLNIIDYNEYNNNNDPEIKGDNSNLNIISQNVISTKLISLGFAHTCSIIDMSNTSIKLEYILRD